MLLDDNADNDDGGVCEVKFGSGGVAGWDYRSMGLPILSLAYATDVNTLSLFK